MEFYFSFVLNLVVSYTLAKAVSKDPTKASSSKCQDSIGIQTGFLETRDIKTSTSQKDFSATDPWCATEQNEKQFMAFDLGEEFQLAKVATMGKADDKNRFVSKYILAYSHDGEKWDDYIDSAGKKEFAGNDNTFAVKSNTLSPSIQARYIKIKPLAWSKGGICTSVDLFGCTVDELNKSKKS